MCFFEKGKHSVGIGDFEQNLDLHCTMQKNTWGWDMAVLVLYERAFQKEHVPHFYPSRLRHLTSVGKI